MNWKGLMIAAMVLTVTACKGKSGDKTKVPVDKVSEAATKVDANAVTLTLPILDALFFEEGFEKQLQDQLNLNREQVEQLKTVSGTFVAGLTEEGNNFGSARQANKSALEKIKAIIGEQKTQALLQLVAQRYSAGEVAGLLPAVPNAIPADTRVVVNAPAYRMDVFQDGKLLKTYKIGIGYPEFPLPTGMRAVQNIIFNPTWTPPNEGWVKGKFTPGRKVAAGSKLNPLGVIKIPIGMPSLIHGGKEPAKLGTFASHGCVGLTNVQVQDFATVMGQLSGTALTIDSVKTFENNRSKTRTVKLGKLIPVELRYETIVAENGSLIIYRDVYERGTNTPTEAARILDLYGVKYNNLPDAEKAALDSALMEMNLDSRGSPVADWSSAQHNNKGEKQAVGTLEQRAKKGKVTRTLKGDTEIRVAIAGLNSKGYPSPVNLDSGDAVSIK